MLTLLTLAVHSCRMDYREIVLCSDREVAAWTAEVMLLIQTPPSSANLAFSIVLISFELFYLFSFPFLFSLLQIYSGAALSR